MRIGDWSSVVCSSDLALERDEAVDARRPLASLLVADMKRAPIGAPDRSRPFEPLLRSDEGRAIAFGPAIIFIDDRPQPLDHPVLDLDRTRRGGVDDLLQRGQVMTLAPRVGPRSGARR